MIPWYIHHDDNKMSSVTLRPVGKLNHNTYFLSFVFDAETPGRILHLKKQTRAGFKKTEKKLDVFSSSWKCLLLKTHFVQKAS